MTKINYQGSIVAMPVSPLKLLQFHVMELENKLKDFVPDGEYCSKWRENFPNFLDPSNDFSNIKE